MTTILAALTFAVNLEHRLRKAQDELFARFGVVSARTLPPLIPIVEVRSRGGEPIFSETNVDRLRKGFPLTCTARSEKLQIEVISGIACIPIALCGWEELREAYIKEIEPELASHTDRSTDPLQSFRTQRPAIHLAWNVPESAGTSISPISPLPETSAFWLTILEIESDAGDWWDGCVYRIPFRRRLSVPRR